ncbi:N-acetylmuramoyl-L-alanine amidase family protein [Nitrolancea hollandica]|uniref:N-acetylmuramoyl-L-alanine amidase n=1 Tax=Nitrolancea hollandica Lb TaxID=1129897 RepID=I4EHJ3_9BACT|nr:N-acetylmuramoyl-L-alanine amidase [Nitrolancea hollandica]CCF84155.1 putative Germination-specific N-acetylmuramoyl-L-alanine amidase [Nitrolancea hollandica Lb]
MGARSRRRILFALLVGCLLAGVLTAPALAAKKPGPAPASRTVCVDAGHGGTDPGAVYGDLKEKDLTLDIAGRLRTLLENSGFTVVMTRTGDSTLGNTERATICNGNGADTVLSIHLNASSDPTIDYFQAFYGKQTKDKAFTQTIQNAYKLASPADPNTDLPKAAITQFASGLLLKTTAPATLAETVFLSNPDEQSLLADSTGTRQQDIAKNLYAGLAAWYASR